MWKVTILTLLVIMSFSGSCLANEETEFLSNKENEFKYVTKFGRMGIVTLGTAEELGIKSTELVDLLALRFKNNLAGMKYEPLNAYPMTVGERKTLGTLWCQVWTVGEN